MKEIDLHYIDPFSLLIIDKAGVLKRLFCPFNVSSICQENIVSGEQLVVEMVRKNMGNEILFVVEGKAHPHYFFKINSS